MPIAAIIDDILEEFLKETNSVGGDMRYLCCLLFTKKPLDYNLISHLGPQPERKYIDPPGLTGLCDSFISL